MKKVRDFFSLSSSFPVPEFHLISLLTLSTVVEDDLELTVSRG